jgi:large repetitive protein
MKRSIGLIALFVFVLCGKIFSACPGSANFSFTTPWCINVPLTFNNTSTGAGVSTYTWDWNDASANTVVATTASQSHTFTTAGVHQVKLIRVFSNGCKDSITQNVTIVNNGVAAPTFSFTPNNGCSTSPVSFTNTTASGGLTFAWNFDDPSTGNKNTSTQNNPSHTFSATGNGGTTSYNVTLTSTNSSGCSNTTTHTVTVGNRPDAALADSNIFFSLNNCGFASVSQQSYYLSVMNNSSTTASNANYLIDWGDGTADFSSATFSQTNHTYAALGIYDMLLTVTGTNGCADTTSYRVINLSNPSVGISGPGSTNGCSPQTFVFNVSLDSANLNYTSYNFNFGDGTPIINWSPPITANTISHTYTTTSCGQTGNQFTVIVTAKNACDSTSATVNNIKISTKPVPNFTYTPSPGCVNSPMSFQNLSTAGCFITGSSTNSATSFVWNWGDGTANTSTTSFANQAHTYTATGTYTVSLTASNPCGASTFTLSLVVTGPPVAKFTNTAPGCAPTTVNFTNQSTGAGLSYNWSVNPSNGITFLDTSNTSVHPQIQFSSSGTYTVTLTTTNNCGVSTKDTILTIKSVPGISLSAIPGGCAPYSTTPSANFTNGGGTITNFAWTFTGGSPVSNATSTPGAVAWNAAGNYTVTASATNECGAATSSTTFTVNPFPTSNAGADKLICEGSSVILGTASTAGLTYSWTSLPSGLTSAVSDPTFSPAVTNTFVVVTSLSGCTKNDTTIVTVNAAPVVSAGSASTVCINSAQFNLSGTPAGGTWSGTGITSAALGTFKPSVAGVGTFTETYSYTDAVTTCSNTATVQVTVDALPTVGAGTDFTECNEPGTITLSDSPAGGTWSGTGVTAGGIFTPSSAGVGNFNLIYTFTSANGCANKDTVKATVINSSPAIAGANDTVCLNATPFSISGFSPAGGTWSGSGITNSSLGTFDPATSGAGTFSLIYSLGSGTCASSDTIIMLVNALPVVSAGANQNICADAATFNLGGNSPAGGTWSGTGITNAANGTFNPTVSGAGTFILTYYVTSATTNCSNSSTKQIVVNALPVVDAGTGTSYCNTPSNVNLSGFSPTGGAWTGDGITNASGIFDPSTASLGNDTLTYTFTDGNGCVSADTVINLIVSPQVANAGSDDTVCVNDAAFTLSGFSPATSTWTGTGITNTNGTFDPAVSGAGTFTLTMSYGSGTCLTQDTKIMKVNALPVLNPGANEIVCLNEAAYNLSGYSPVGGTWTGTGITNGASGTFDPAVAGTGTFVLTYTFTDPTTNCTTSTTKQITVNTLPVVDAGTGATVCNQSITHTLTGFSPAGGTWSGTGVSAGGVFTPSLAGVGTFTLTYSFTSGANCIVSDTVIMTVIPPTFANAGSNDTICLNGGILNLSGFSPAGGTWTGTGITNSSGVFDPTVSSDGNFTLRYTFGSATCLTQDTKIIRVDSMPFIVAGANETTCISTNAYNLSGFSPVGGSWSGTGITNAAAGTFDPATATAGTYTLTYTYTDPQTSCTDFKTKTITVEALPVLAYTHPSPSCVNAPTIFTNNTTGATVFDWDFGDGNSSAQNSPSNVYAAVGNYTVQLIASTANGCKDSMSTSIELIKPPVANFTQSPDTGCSPLIVNFTDLSSGSFISYNWNFGNGTSSNDTTPSFATYLNGSDDTSYIVVLTVSNLCASVSHKDTVTVFYPWVNADFGTDFSFNCSPMYVQFGSLSLGTVTSMQWDFGDGTTGSGSNPPMHTYYYNGTNDTTYNITLYASNHCRADTITKSITVLPNYVNAFFNTSSPSGCAPFTATFTDFSDGATNVSWDFGDGNVSSVQSPSHTFTNAGTYTIFQYVTNGCGFDTATASITVYPSAGIAFTFSPSPVCINQPISFNNTTTGGIGYNWNFGDGSSSIVTSPSHSYTSGGTFTVTLTATSQTNGCVDSLQKILTVFQPPVPAFTPTPLFGCQPLDVTFTNTSTNSNFYTWDFNNGNTSSAISPSTTFDSVGTYTISLLAENLNGCKDSLKMQVNVYPVPTASFTSDTSYGCAIPFAVTFTNTSTGAVGYNWDFGNFQTTVSTNGNAVYTSSGTYSISLVASNTYGCTDSATASFTVFPKPVADFTPVSSTGCDPFTVQFQNASINGTSYQWTFSNGASNIQTNPSVVFTSPGTYDVQLIATSGGSCSDTFSVSNAVTVNPSPTAAFTYTQIKKDDIADGTIGFTNASVSAISYEWSFGDGSTATDTDPIHQYTMLGHYTVTLTALNSFGCTDTTEQVVIPDYFQGLFVPNAFMPNSPFSDLRFFKPAAKSLKTYKVQVFDTWGALIWESTSLNADGSPSEGWDGTYDGKPCQQDVYVWKIEAMFLNGEIWRGQVYPNGKIQPTGSVHIIR